MLRPATLDGSSVLEPARFKFLNKVHHFTSVADIDWNLDVHGKLWTYNLNYFEFLRERHLSTAFGLVLIEDWISKADYIRDGWEPYPLSLRLIHWLQFFRLHSIPISVTIARSLRRQYDSLWHKIEYHLDGNHLLENALALTYCSVLLGSPLQLERAAQLTRNQLAEQYLPSGEHYERSFMYHSILLYRQLDLLSALASDHWLYVELADSISRQVGYGDSQIGASGGFPHFNDCTNGIAPEWQMIKTYATALGISPIQPSPQYGIGRYVHWQEPDYDFWFDIAPIGPDHIPGHAHADSLSICLQVGGEDVLVDTGISTYEKNERRQYERSTSAHNTVTIDEQNSSDVWGGFRVGRRTITRLLVDTPLVVSASHDGFVARKSRHKRTVSRANHRITIEDEILGQHSNLKGTARLHLGAGCTLRDSEIYVDGARIKLEFTNATTVTVGNYDLSLGFNHRQTAVVISVKFMKNLTTTLLINRTEPQAHQSAQEV